MTLISHTFDADSVIVRVKILNSSVSTGAGLTGLDNTSSGLIIGTIADNEASTTTYTVAASNVETIATLGTYAAPTASKCRFKEVDATNHPGVYELQFADARFAIASSLSLLISVSGATNLAECDALIWLDKFGTPTPLVAGSAATFAGNFIDIHGDTKKGLRVTDKGQSQGSATLVVTLSAAAPNDDDVLNGQRLVITGGTGLGQVRRIVDYNGTTKEATVSKAWDTQPDGTSLYEVHPNDGFSVSTFAAGLAQSATSSTVTLAASETFSDDEINDQLIVIISGTGAGQARMIDDWTLSTKVADIMPNWVTTPDSTSGYEIVAAGVDVLHIEGADATNSIRDALVDDSSKFSGADLALIMAALENAPVHTLAGDTALAGTSTTIQLASSEPFLDDELNGNKIQITGGTGRGQSRTISDYAASTTTVTVSAAWTTTPDSTSVYQVVHA